jgi:uncharacterized membrane protein
MASMLSAMGVGAALMYFLDPDRGVRRRALARNKLVHAAKMAGDSAGTASRDLGNRARGAVAEVRSRFTSNDADDRVLEERVRSELGRIVSHPGAIDVMAGVDGRVLLIGDVLDDEVDELMSRVSRVRGVSEVVNELQVHESPEGVPALQGGRERDGGEFELLQENWSPAARVLTGAVGGALAFYAARRRNGVLGSAVGLAGLALLARGSTNRPLKRVIGTGGGRRAIDVQKTIHIQAPVEDVFAYLTDWENFPRWMTHVREVRASGPRGESGEHTHWVVDGPAGTTISWNALTTRFVANELVVWRSVNGAAVRHAGRMRFESDEDGGTRVHVQLSYNPPAGVLGHGVAAFFGRDPKKQMDDDLARLKTTIETGAAPRDAAAAEAVQPVQSPYAD